MKKQKNFGLSHQKVQRESYDNFKLGKDWDLGFISKKGIENRQDAKKAETERKRMQTQIMAQVASEPTQQNQAGISAGVALTIGAIVVVSLFVGLRVINNRRKAKQASTVQETTQVVNQIV